MSLSSLKKFDILLQDLSDDELMHLANKSKLLTKQYFGNTIQLYIPLYLSNECSNGCLYCGFNKDNSLFRETLSLDKVIQEMHIIKKRGFDNILLLTGEQKETAGVEYLIPIIKEAKKKFSFIGLEIFPCSKEEYVKLINAGASGVTIYQETYNKKKYNDMHLFGPKKDYHFRYEAPERALKAGIRKIGLGCLLGLHDWREDILSLANHLSILMKKYWRAEFSISFPRIHNTPNNIKLSPVTERNLIQIIIAFRLSFPQVGLILSTRENPIIRDICINLGINQISAESKTNPGGYSCNNNNEQFQIQDNRPLNEIITVLQQNHLEPIFKDWSTILSKSIY
jgi:2-iminoacetate synthase